MWQFTRIKNSDHIVFENFDIFYTIAKQMKGCHYYYIDALSHKMYACNEEGYALHVVDIPEVYYIPQSIYFDILLLNETIIKQYGSFMIYKDLPWLMLPTDTAKDHFNYELSMINSVWCVLSGTQPIDYLLMYSPEVEEFTVRKIFNLVIAKKSIDKYLGELQLFGNLENNSTIRTVFDNKASNGRKYLRLTNMNGKNYGMMIFKNLFNLNKADELTVVIRDRIDKPGVFEASFITTKKKSPIPTIIPFFKESTYAMFLNI